MSPLPEHAIQVGDSLAEQVVAFRDSALASSASRNGGAANDGAATVLPVGTRTVLWSRESVGTLIAEGDSWFAYPWTNVIRILEDEYRFDVESVASNGDRVQEMAYSGGQLEGFTRALERVLRRGAEPQAVLLSGGGNDITGAQLPLLLNHARQMLPPLNSTLVDAFLEERLLPAYVTVISALTRVCVERVGKRVPIVVHGYDYAVPDGRGFLGGGWVLPGPWLEPGFRVMGYGRNDIDATKDAIRALIDRFNDLLLRITQDDRFTHIRYVNLRDTLSSGVDYRDWWENELHPTERGFAAVADRIARAITSL